MGEIIKVPDILVYKGGALHSLRDQKICKNGTLQNFAPGCGVVKGKNLYVLDESEERVPIVTMVTAKQSVSFTVDKTSDIEVDWGDSITEANVFSHTYTDGLEHTIRFYGSSTTLLGLSCDSNLLTILDVSRNVGLTMLHCYYNQLTTLDVSKCRALTELGCRSNQLTYLDVSGCTVLYSLDCYENRLTTLNVSGSPALKSLECTLNQLGTLDLSENQDLTNLVCFSNKLTILDISKCTALTYLNCFNNQIVALDVSGCMALTYLNCHGNQIVALDISGCMALKTLKCPSNPFVSDNTQMTALANSLPDRTGKEKGTLEFLNSVIQPSIQPICNSKNWQITAP